MAYRGEYFISLVAMFVLELIGPLFVYIIYFNSSGFAGWTFHQVLLLHGIFLMVKGFSFMSFFGIVWNSNELLKRGVFDLVLLKPRNVLFMFICNSYDAEDMAKFFGGILVTVYALLHIQGVTLLGVLGGVFVMLFGVGLLFSMALLFSAFAFKFIRSERIYEIFEILGMIGSYPKTVYPKLTGTIFTALLPIFVVAVFPAQVMLKGWSVDILVSCISVIVLVAVSLMVWFKTIKNYSSAGG